MLTEAQLQYLEERCKGPEHWDITLDRALAQALLEDIRVLRAALAPFAAAWAEEANNDVEGMSIAIVEGGEVWQFLTDQESEQMTTNHLRAAWDALHPKESE